MAITREQAFGVFEDLLGGGLRPVVTGFRSQEDDQYGYWPKGSEGFFVYCYFSSTTRLGVLITDLQKMNDIAEKHGLMAWFSGRSDEYDEGGEFKVVFEKS